MIQVQQGRWRMTQGWLQPLDTAFLPQVLLVKGNFPAGAAQTFLTTLAQTFPEALIMGCSTAGQIAGVQLYEQEVVVTALRFEQTRCVLVQEPLPEPSASFETGQSLAEGLLKSSEAAALKHVLVLSEGLNVNGSALVRGLQSRLPATVSLQDQTIARIQITDSGIGIPLALQQQIFEPFFQAESNYDRRYEGTGLGLAICRSLCASLGYTLRVQSQAGQGSCFELLLMEPVD